MMQSIGEEQEREDILSHNQLIDAVNRGNEHVSQYLIFSKLLRLQEKPKNSGRWQINVLFDNGDETWEPVSVIRKDSPLKRAKYAFENKLTDTTGWKWTKKCKKAKRISLCNEGSSQPQKNKWVEYSISFISQAQVTLSQLNLVSPF